MSYTGVSPGSVSIMRQEEFITFAKVDEEARARAQFVYERVKRLHPPGATLSPASLFGYLIIPATDALANALHEKTGRIFNREDMFVMIGNLFLHGTQTSSIARGVKTIDLLAHPACAMEAERFTAVWKDVHLSLFDARIPWDQIDSVRNIENAWSDKLASNFVSDSITITYDDDVHSTVSTTAKTRRRTERKGEGYVINVASDAHFYFKVGQRTVGPGEDNITAAREVFTRVFKSLHRMPKAALVVADRGYVTPNFVKALATDGIDVMGIVGGRPVLLANTKPLPAHAALPRRKRGRPSADASDAEPDSGGDLPAEEEGNPCNDEESNPCSDEEDMQPNSDGDDDGPMGGSDESDASSSSDEEADLPSAAASTTLSAPATAADEPVAFNGTPLPRSGGRACGRCKQRTDPPHNRTTCNAVLEGNVVARSHAASRVPPRNTSTTSNAAPNVLFSDPCLGLEHVHVTETAPVAATAAAETKEQGRANRKTIHHFAVRDFRGNVLRFLYSTNKSLPWIDTWVMVPKKLSSGTINNTLFHPCYPGSHEIEARLVARGVLPMTACQRSFDWFVLRRYAVTGSIAGELLSYSRSHSMAQVFTKLAKKFFDSRLRATKAMRIGQQNERLIVQHLRVLAHPNGRLWFPSIYEVGSVSNRTTEFATTSPDAVGTISIDADTDDEEDVLFEFKTTTTESGVAHAALHSTEQPVVCDFGSEEFLTLVPPQHRTQLLHCTTVCNMNKIVYVRTSPSLSRLFCVAIVIVDEEIRTSHRQALRGFYDRYLSWAYEDNPVLPPSVPECTRAAFQSHLAMWRAMRDKVMQHSKPLEPVHVMRHAIVEYYNLQKSGVDVSSKFRARCQVGKLHLKFGARWICDMALDTAVNSFLLWRIHEAHRSVRRHNWSRAQLRRHMNYSSDPFNDYLLDLGVQLLTPRALPMCHSPHAVSRAPAHHPAESQATHGEPPVEDLQREAAMVPPRKAVAFFRGEIGSQLRYVNTNNQTNHCLVLL